MGLAEAYQTRTGIVAIPLVPNFLNAVIRLLSASYSLKSIT